MWSPAGLSLLLFPAEALRPHQLFGQRAAAVFWTGKAELTFCTFHPPINSPCSFPIKPGERRAEDEVPLYVLIETFCKALGEALKLQ